MLESGEVPPSLCVGAPGGKGRIMGKGRGKKRGAESRDLAAASPQDAEADFAALLTAHIRTSGVRKVELARAIGTKPQYIREIETRRKPPPTLEKVEILAASLGLSAADRDRFFARAREGRTKPESRELLRTMNEVFAQLMEMLAVTAEERSQIHDGDHDLLIERLHDALGAAGKIELESEFLPVLQVMRYRSFVKTMLDGLDSLGEQVGTADVEWVQNELVGQMERMSGLRRGQADLIKRVKKRK